jgi:hypothetical protein
MAELRATPMVNPVMGLLADRLKKVQQFGAKPFGYENPPVEMLMNLLGVPAVQQTMERMAYGEPLTTGRGMTTKPRAEAVEAAMAVAPVAGLLGKTTEKAAMAAGRIGEKYAEKVVPQILEGGGLPASLLQDLAQGTKSQIFIGQKSKAWNKDAAELAKKLEKDGESAEVIWEKTGTFKSPDGKWRQEISDQNIELRSKKIGIDREGNPIIMSTREGKAYQVMEHPELYDAYPFTRKIETEIGNKPVTSGATEYGDEGRFLEAYGPTDEDIKSALVHEMQHQIQNREGMASGSGFMAGDKEDFQRYLRAAGEAEARAVQSRRNLSMEERRKLFPLSSYDVPINELDTSLPQKLDFGFLRSLL